ncbi:MAG: hypothetical protein IPK19_39100 [Chloroflexi bacterium]|nr:hypothetical protein [Chloroflexota bacterium]
MSAKGVDAAAASAIPGSARSRSGNALVAGPEIDDLNVEKAFRLFVLLQQVHAVDGHDGHQDLILTTCQEDLSPHPGAFHRIGGEAGDNNISLGQTFENLLLPQGTPDNPPKIDPDVEAGIA